MIDFSRTVYCVLGLPFDAVDMSGAIQRVRHAAESRTPCFFSTPNLNFVIGSRKDINFRDSVINSDLSVADGMPLVWVARLLGIPINERVAGSTLYDSLGEHMQVPLSVYFFGGQEGVAESAFLQRYADPKGLICAGFYCPGFGTVEDMSGEDTIQRINASSADFLIVSLGARKGQAWIERNRARLTAPVISHLGAVLNFVAGTVRRAPIWMQRSGLEWLWRIKEEPALRNRYFSDGVEFLSLMLTRVLPYAWYLRWHQPSVPDLETATVDFSGQDLSVFKVNFKGAWSAWNIEKMRFCITRAASMEQDIQLDLTQVTYVDSAFIGMVMLLYKSQRKHVLGLSIVGAQKTVQSVFRWNCAEFLLE